MEKTKKLNQDYESIWIENINLKNEVKQLNAQIKMLNEELEELSNEIRHLNEVIDDPEGF